MASKSVNGTMENGKNNKPMNFASKLIAAIPHGRRGKHDLIVSQIMSDLERLNPDTALLVPLDGLDGEKMANVRSALNRATKGKKMSVATSTDEKYFYVWRTEGDDIQPMVPPAHTNGIAANGKLRG